MESSVGFGLLEGRTYSLRCGELAGVVEDFGEKIEYHFWIGNGTGFEESIALELRSWIVFGTFMRFYQFRDKLDNT